jgi:hypothetical protein
VGAELIAWSFTSGWASGVNAYAVVLVMGLIGRFGDVAVIPGALTRTDVLVAAGMLFLVEMVADKVPFLDSAWDAAHLVIRPAVGATLGYLLGHDSSSLQAAFSAATGGVTALASHAVKAGVRLGVNTSPEPASNAVISTAEDVAVAGVITLATAQPWLAAGVSALLLVVGLALALALLSRARRLKRRYDAWGASMLARRGRRLNQGAQAPGASGPADPPGPAGRPLP